MTFGDLSLQAADEERSRQLETYRYDCYSCRYHHKIRMRKDRGLFETQKGYAITIQAQ
jgi:hypothetical protein